MLMVDIELHEKSGGENGVMEGRLIAALLPIKIFNITKKRPP
jgi:hypothetical protein